MMRKRLIILILIILLILAAAFYAAGEWFRRRDFSEELAGMRGSLASIEIMSQKRGPAHLDQTLKLESDSGIEVFARIKVPRNGVKRQPAVVILGGLRTGRNTVDYLDEMPGIVMLALDYPYQGPKEELGFFEFAAALPSMHRAVLETVPAVLLGVDYLLARDDIDPERIILVGGSLGALFVPAVMAADDRISAAAILFGGADVERLVRSDLDLPFPLSYAAGWLCAVLVSPAEPLKYADEISPRPLFMLNGRNDPRIPEECVLLLHETAGEPKTIRWIDSGHLSVQSAEFQDMVSLELIKWLNSKGLIQPR